MTLEVAVWTCSDLMDNEMCMLDGVSDEDNLT